MPTGKLSAGQYKVAVTCFLSLFSIVGIMFYGLPFFFDFWVKDFGWSRATVTSGNIVGKIIVGPLLGYAAGWFTDKFGPRKLLISGIVIAGLAVMGFGFMNSIWAFYFFYFLVSVGYMFGGPLPNQVLISRWFDQSRGRAMAVAYLGIGIGGMFVPQIAKLLNSHMNWRLSLIFLGILMIVVAIPMAWFVKENPAGIGRGGGFPDPLEVLNQPQQPKIPFKRIFRTRSFYLLAIGSMCSIGAVSGISQNLKLFFSLDLKYSQAHSADLISTVLGASIIGRLLMGWLADLYSKKFVMILIYSLISASILLLNYASVPGVIYLFAFVFGIGLGGDYMVIPLMAAELFGTKVMGRVMGLILTIDGLGEAFGPVIAGGLRDRTKSYALGFTALILLSVIGTIAVAFLPGKTAKEVLAE